MLREFSRSELIFGKEATVKLKNSKVALFGLGGVGGYVLEALARSGVGHIEIVDNDKVNLTNINRQIIAVHSTLGMLKTDAWEKRIKDINPECVVVKHDLFYLPENGDSFDFKNFDYVVDAVDTVSAKIDLALRCERENVPVISSMGTGNKTDPTMFKVADIYETKVCPLARVMRNELKKRGVSSLNVVYSEEKPKEQDEKALEEYFEHEGTDIKKVPPGSNAFVPAAAGLIIASKVIKDLIK